MLTYDLLIAFVLKLFMLPLSLLKQIDQSKANTCSQDEV